jgi:hypothetical protein
MEAKQESNTAVGNVLIIEQREPGRHDKEREVRMCL